MRYLALALLSMPSCAPCGLLANADYTTPSCMSVIDESGLCPESSVVQWEEELVGVWSSIYDRGGVEDAIHGKYLVCLDAPHFNAGAWAGYCDGEAAWVSNDPTKVRGLYMHEVSHLVLVPYLGWDAAAHHAAIEDAGY